jgi:glycosyltransferase involved in cell wall biosynthesis
LKPLVTVAIPTYERPDLLRRALGSVANQTYENIEVLVSDNASPGDATDRVIEAFRLQIPNLTYTKHATNIGSIANFQSLLRRASGLYFMWLADDDEISPTYIESLVGLLESDATAASAAGRWILMRDARSGRPMPTASFPEASALARALKFIWHTDDAFFYALHRTTTLRQATFPGYVQPNRGVTWNWAYVLLMDVVLRGRVVRAEDEAVQFINHDYTSKSYGVGPRSWRAAIARPVRRLNVHALYWSKCARVIHPAALPLVMAVSLLSLFREAGASGRRLFDSAASRRADE